MCVDVSHPFLRPYAIKVDKTFHDTLIIKLVFC